jgi:hypothetical protein
VRDLRAALERKQWVQLREATYAAVTTLQYLAACCGSADAARALEGIWVVLGRGWNGRGIYRDPAEPPPGADAYRTAAEEVRRDSYDEWMAARRAARVAVVGEDRHTRWEADLAGRSFLAMLSGNETDELLDVMTGLWQEATATETTAPG